MRQECLSEYRMSGLSDSDPCRADRLLGDHAPLRRPRRVRRRRRDREREPGIPSVPAVLRAELLVGLEIDVALQFPERDDVSQLRTDAGHPGLEAADPVAGAAVARELLVG